MIDFTAAPLDAYGDEFKIDDKGVTATLGKMCVMALDAALKGDSEKASDTFARGALAIKIVAAEKSNTPLADLSAEDITLLKDRIGKRFPSASLVYAVWRMLDQNSKG